MRHMLLAVAITVVFLAPPVLAGGPEAIFADHSHLFTPDDGSRVNASFVAVKARLKARQALKKPTPNKLVETGGDIDVNETNVNINGLLLTPGAPPIPRSVREIIIVGGRTDDVTVSGRR